MVRFRGSRSHLVLGLMVQAGKVAAKREVRQWQGGMPHLHHYCNLPLREWALTWMLYLRTQEVAPPAAVVVEIGLTLLSHTLSVGDVQRSALK